MEQNLTLQEQLSDADQQGSSQASSSLPPSGARLTQKLHAEIASCLSDLRSLCSILTQRAQGKDPNLSLLLGLTGKHWFIFIFLFLWGHQHKTDVFFSPAAATQLATEPAEDWMNPEVLQRKLVEAQQLRRDVEELRKVILDRYAQDMGENCITQ